MTEDVGHDESMLSLPARPAIYMFPSSGFISIPELSLVQRIPSVFVSIISTSGDSYGDFGVIFICCVSGLFQQN